MNHLASLSAAVCLTLAALPAVVQAETIATIHIGGQFGARGVFDQIEATVGIGGAEGEALTFFDLPLSEADVGHSFGLSSGATFDAAVAYLTNGVNDAMQVFSMSPFGGGGFGANEAFWFFGDGSGARGIDLAGHQITGMAFRLNSLHFDIDTGTPWTDASYDYSVTIESIPEPGTVMLFALGLAGLYSRLVCRARMSSASTPSRARSRSTITSNSTYSAPS